MFFYLKGTRSDKQMLPQQISIQPTVFKKEWNANEMNEARKYINRFFEITADWDNSVSDMGLTYRVQDYAALCALGDFYLDEGVRISAFALTEEGRVILIGIEDEEEQLVYYELEEY
jgi:hypothetical protein